MDLKAIITALSMRPGRDLDAAVDLAAFGRKSCPHEPVYESDYNPESDESEGHYHCKSCGWGGYYKDNHPSPAPYSTDMGAAWGLLEHLREQKGYDFVLRVTPQLSVVYIFSPDKLQRAGRAEGIGVTALALCKAVLQMLAAEQMR